MVELDDLCSLTKNSGFRSKYPEKVPLLDMLVKFDIISAIDYYESVDKSGFKESTEEPNIYRIGQLYKLVKCWEIDWCRNYRQLKLEDLPEIQKTLDMLEITYDLDKKGYNTRNLTICEHLYFFFYDPEPTKNK